MAAGLPGLAALQAALGAAIREPFDFSTGKFACRTEAYPAPAAEAVKPLPGGDARSRLMVYNQQYWYRLLRIMQQDFPLLGATLGLWEFNRLASGYLSARPSRSPFLDRLAEGFSGYIDALPQLSRRIKDIVRLEAACLEVFHAPRRAPLDPARLSPAERENLAGRSLEFQPWFRLFEEAEDLVANRRKLEARFGPREEPARPEFTASVGYWALFRSEGRVDTRRLDRDQFRILSSLYAGDTLEAACERAAESEADAGFDAHSDTHSDTRSDAQSVAQSDVERSARLAAALPGWFAAWTGAGWFAHPGSPELLGWESA